MSENSKILKSIALERNMKILSFLLILFFTVNSWSGKYSEEKQLTLDAQSIDLLVIDCGAGFLEVKGVENAEEIEVKAEIFISDIDQDRVEEFLEKTLRLYLEKDGDRAVLESGFDYKSSFWERIFDGHPRTRIDLTVKVPRKIDLRIDDGSGKVMIENIEGSVRLDDGSGETTIRRITGDVRVDDGSGELHITDIGGDVKIDDGSGEIIVRDVKGTVRVDDGSGSIKISGVSQDVIIEDDGSGSVKISDVEGEIVRRDN
jgi:hypothetical protein